MRERKKYWPLTGDVTAITVSKGIVDIARSTHTTVQKSRDALLALLALCSTGIDQANENDFQRYKSLRS